MSSNQASNTSSSAHTARNRRSTIRGPAQATLIGAAGNRTTQVSSSGGSTTAQQLEGQQVEVEGRTPGLPPWWMEKDEVVFRDRFKELKDNSRKSDDYVDKNPVCDNCSRSGQKCVPTGKGKVACTFCRQKKRGCPRLRASYGNGMAGYKGMSEEEALSTLEALNLIKYKKDARNTLAHNFRAEPGDDDENDVRGSEDEDGDAQTDAVVRRMSEVRISPQATGETAEDNDHDIAAFKEEIARLYIQLEKSKAAEAAARKEISKKGNEQQAKITNLEAKLARERKAVELMRAQSQHDTSNKQAMNEFVNQLGLFCRDLRIAEKDLRTKQRADTTSLVQVVTKLQDAVDIASLEMPRNTAFDTIPVCPSPSDSTSEKRKRTLVDDPDSQNESSAEGSLDQEVWVGRAKITTAAGSSTGRPGPSGSDRGEGPSNSKRLRH